MIVNSKILKTASVLSLLAAAAFSGVAGAAESADASPVFQEGTYVLKMGKKFLGHDVYFDLRNGGDTIDLPRGEITLKKNEQGVHVNGCFSMYRGAEVIVDRQCGYKGGQIYCRTVPDWVEVQPGNEELNNIEEVIEVFISPVDMEHMAVTVSDPSFSAGGSVENFNQNSYTLVKDRPSKCRPAQ